jgi:hypothetical protein
MRKLLIVLPLIVLAATGADAARDKVPDATPSGPPVSCINLVTIQRSYVRSDSVIDFDMGGGRYYRNTLPQACPQLGFEQKFSYETSLSKLCSTDIITVLQDPPIMRGASCGLGQFQPVTMVKAAKR